MTTLQPPAPRVERTPPALSRTEVGVLVAAPLSAILARLLLTPMYQDESDQPDNARFLADIAGSAVANDVGAAVTLLSAVLFGAAALVIGRLVRAGSRRVGWVGRAGAAVGAFGLAGYAGLAGTFATAGGVDDRATMIDFYDRLYTSYGGSWWLFLVLGAVGWLALGWGLFRTRTAPRTAAVIAAVGGAGVMVTTPGPAVAFVAGSAAISLVGLTWSAAALGSRTHRRR